MITFGDPTLIKTVKAAEKDISPEALQKKIQALENDYKNLQAELDDKDADTQWERDQVENELRDYNQEVRKACKCVLAYLIAHEPDSGVDILNWRECMEQLRDIQELP